jgi:hypothetical protein
MNEDSKDPDTLVAEAIAGRFESQFLLGSQEKEALTTTIANGKMEMSDWILLAEKLHEQKEAVES